MRVRNAVAVTVLTAGMSYPLAGVALAQDLDCADFSTQAQAQAVLNQDPSDPNRLDTDNDGVACEGLPGAPGSAENGTNTGDRDTGVAPSGGVEAGAGGTAGGDDTGLLLPIGLAGGTLLIAGGVVLIRRRPVEQSD